MLIRIRIYEMIISLWLFLACWQLLVQGIYFPLFVLGYFLFLVYLRRGLVGSRLLGIDLRQSLNQTVKFCWLHRLYVLQRCFVHWHKTSRLKIQT